MSNRRVRSRESAALVLSLACSLVGTSVAASADMNWDVDLSTVETRRSAVSDSVRASTDDALREVYGQDYGEVCKDWGRSLLAEHAR